MFELLTIYWLLTLPVNFIIVWQCQKRLKTERRQLKRINLRLFQGFQVVCILFTLYQVGLFGLMWLEFSGGA